MITKFDIGQDVYIKGTVKKIEVNEYSNTPIYRVTIKAIGENCNMWVHEDKIHELQSKSDDEGKL